MGAHEIPGPKSELGLFNIIALLLAYSDLDETPWCLTGDTEILTDGGWVRFDILGEQKRLLKQYGKMNLFQPIEENRKGIKMSVYLRSIMRESNF